MNYTGWNYNTVKMVCGAHGDGELYDMAPRKTTHGVFYVCTCLNCTNAISQYERDAAVDHLAAKVMGANLTGGMINLCHHQWRTKKNTAFEVITDERGGESEDNIVVKVIDSAPLRAGRQMAQAEETV